MNQKGYFEVPMPVAIILGLIVVSIFVMLIFTAGVAFGMAKEAERCTAQKQEQKGQP